MARKLGQHFLENPIIAEKTVKCLSASKSDTILEIGPGKGFLTSYLLDSGASVTGVEIDSLLTEYLKKTIKEKKFSIINKDFLDFDLDASNCNKICGNIPYQISGKIIEKIMLSRLNWTKSVIMLPYAIGKRIVALPGSKDYSFLSVVSSVNCKPEIEFMVEKEDFNIQPSIDSVVVSFLRNGPALNNKFYTMTKAVFSSRNKKIGNTLSNYFSKSAVEINKIINEAGLDKDCRARNIGLEEIKKLKEKFEDYGII